MNLKIEVLRKIQKLVFVDKDNKRHEIKRLPYVYNGILEPSEERLIEVSDTRITGD